MGPGRATQPVGPRYPPPSASDVTGSAACGSDWPESVGSGPSTPRPWRGLDAVDQLVVADANPALAAAVADRAGARGGRRRRSPARLGDRRLRHHHRDPRPRPPAAPGHRRRHPDVLREARRRHSRRDPRPHPARRVDRRSRFTSASSAGSTAATAGRARPSRRASSAPCTPSAPTPTTRRRRTRPTSPRAAGIFRDCSSTTSTSSASSPAARWSASTPPAPTRASPSSREAGDVDTAAALLTLDDGTLVMCTATRYNGAATTCGWRSSAATAPSPSGLDDSLAMHSAEAGRRLPARARSTGRSWSASCPAYRAELTAFLDVAAGRRRARAPCATPSRRSASPRRASSRAPSGASSRLSEIHTVEA